MRISKITISLITLLFAGSLWAQNQSTAPIANPTSTEDTKASFSEAYFHPAPGKNRISLIPRVSKYTYKSQSNFSWRSYQKNLESQVLGFEFSHGFQDSSWALNLGLDMGQSNSSVLPWGSRDSRGYRFNGFGDLQIQLASLTNVEKTNFLYGTELSLSPGSAKQATRSSDGNRVSGGHSLAPFAAIEQQTGFGSMGAKLQYRLMGQREFEADNDYAGTEYGQNILSLAGFSELNSGTNRYGAELTLSATEKGSFEDNSGEDNKGDWDPSNSGAVSVYGFFPMDKGFAVKPALSYSSLLSKNIDDQKVHTSENVGLSVQLSGSF